MHIKLNNIMPEPLASIQHSHDSIWGNSVELKPAHRIMLNASSGKGKTTFAGIIYGLRHDYSGTVTFNGEDIRQLNPDHWTEIRKSKISAIFQDLQLFPDLTVRENLLLKNRLTDTYSEVELKQMMQRMEIENKWEQECGLLSMGQRQRVAIIRALSQPYEWLILDEPFSHLDVANAERCLNMIHDRTVQQDAGFVLTSLGSAHDYAYDYELKL
ncbi:MAG: ATP-binding cassette domain-containing protein [Fluviicola sp.]